MGPRLDCWLKEAACGWMEKHRPQVGLKIKGTVEGWDIAELSTKLELEVGAVLQCVCINGTLIGRGVGLLLQLCSKLFA